MQMLKRIWSDYGIGTIIVLLFACYGLYLLANYISGKGAYGGEYMTSTPNPAYSNSQQQGSMYGGGAVQPSEEPIGQNEVFSAVHGIKSSSIQGLPSSCNPANTIQNPADLLPKDNNSEWAKLNPSGQGALANIALLRAGYNQGIDTVGSSLRNANLQERSEPPNPQVPISIFNQSTISSDFMRPPLELGQGSV